MLTATLVAALALPSAQAAPQLQISSPAHGSSFDFNAASYDVANEALQLSGRIVGIPSQPLPPGYAIYVNGMPALTAPGAATGVDYTHPVAVGTGAPYWNPGGGWPLQTPYRDVMMDARRMYLPLLVEVAKISTGQVYARQRVVVLDRRGDEFLKQNQPATFLQPAAMAQLTPTGVQRLEPLHASTLPFPDNAAFQAAIADQLALEPSQQAALSGACRNIATVPDFYTLPAFTTAMTLAGAEYAAFQAASAAGLPIALGMCVQRPPLVTDFEVCVNELDGRLSALTVEGVEQATLALMPPDGRFGSDVVLQLPEGTVRVNLRDITIRSTQGAPGCLPRPVASVAPSTIDRTPWLSSWATCHNPRISSPRADSLGPWAYGVSPDPADDEGIATGRVVPSSFVLSSTAVDVGTRTCADSFIRADVEDFVASFGPTVQSVLTTVWDADAVDTQQAIALDALLSPFETGTCPVTGLDTTLGIHDVWTDPQEGMGVSYTARVTEQVSASSSPTFEVFRALDDFPIQPGSPFYWSTDGKDPWGDPFDLSFAISTNQLNQWLSAGARGEAFQRDITFTYNDVGATPPAGALGTDVIRLSGTMAASRLPPLAQAGFHEVQLRVRPTLPPFLWMPLDPMPPHESIGDVPVNFQAADILVDIVERAPGGDLVLFTLAVDVYDPDFQIGLDSTPGAKMLDVGWGQPQWTFTAITNNLRTCKQVLHVNNAINLRTCERSMESVFGSIVRPVLEQRLLALLEEVPAPQHFDALGYASPERQVLERSRTQWASLITMWATLE